MASLINGIIEALQQPLPGESAQYAMAPPLRRAPIHTNQRVKQAAVMVLLYQDNTEWHIVYMKRVSNAGHERHRGQISFPGGTRDHQDRSYEETALREVHEEIGISPDYIQILGSLSPLFIPVSNFNVHPFVGWIKSEPNFNIQPSEVESLLTVPLSLLKDKSSRKRMDMPINKSSTIKDVPFFDLQGEILWGASAMMTSEFLTVIEGK